MKTKPSFDHMNHYWESFDQSDHDDLRDCHMPKKSPMHRKEKFRTVEFSTRKNPRESHRNWRRTIRYDFDLAEE